MLGFIKKTYVIAELEARKIFHDPTEIVLRAIQPALWLLVFGQVFAKMRAAQGQGNYLDFMTPGILAQSILFVSIFYGIAIIWERDLGLTHKLLATPTPRTALVLGKAISAGIRCLPIVTFLYALAALMRVHIDWNPLCLLGVLLMTLLGAIAFSTLSLILACLVKTRERFMGIGQVLTMPLFFASNAIYPIELMPSWLKIVAGINPLTYMINALRALMIQGMDRHRLPLDFAILLVAAFALVSLGGFLYRRVIA